MNHQAPGADPRPAQLKQFIVETLKLREVRAEQITDDEPLLDGRLGLDSLDALSLAIGLEEDWGITIHSHDELRSAFASITSLAAFIGSYAPESPRSPVPMQPVRTAAA